MNVFDCKKEVVTITDNGNTIRYTKETYPYTNTTYYTLKCPHYLHSALRTSYGKYGVDVCDKNHITLTEESGIVEVWNEIKKGVDLYNEHHSGESVDSMAYGRQHQLCMVFVKGNFDDFGRFMVNHQDKRVSACHGYPGSGRDYAKKKGYEYVDLW